MTCLQVNVKLIFFFSHQDLPEFFEDNMETWMTNFHSLLTLDNKLLQTDVSDRSSYAQLEMFKQRFTCALKICI